MARTAFVWSVAALLVAAPPATGGWLAASDSQDQREGGLAAAAAPALADVLTRFGSDVRLLSIEIHEDETVIAVQDPAVPAHVDRHTYTAAGHEASAPLAVGRNLRRLRAQLFRMSEVDVTVLPRLLASAPALVDTEDGAVTHAILDRSQGMGDVESWGSPRWRVYVDGPRGGGYVEYDLKGDRKRVMRW